MFVFTLLHSLPSSLLSPPFPNPPSTTSLHNEYALSSSSGLSHSTLQQVVCAHFGGERNGKCFLVGFEQIEMHSEPHFEPVNIPTKSALKRQTLFGQFFKVLCTKQACFPSAPSPLRLVFLPLLECCTQASPRSLFGQRRRGRASLQQSAALIFRLLNPFLFFDVQRIFVLCDGGDRGRIAEEFMRTSSSATVGPTQQGLMLSVLLLHDPFQMQETTPYLFGEGGGRGDLRTLGQVYSTSLVYHAYIIKRTRRWLFFADQSLD